MKKLNISFINDGNKEDAILKIKDDSFSITTKDNSIIKIPYSDIKDYEYTEKEILTLKRKHNSDIIVEVSFDITLINTLKQIVNNSNSINENVEFEKNHNIQEKNDVKAISDNNIQERQETSDNNITQQQNNANQNNSDIGIGLKLIITIASLIVGIIFTANVFSTDESKTIEGGREAEIYALREIPESVLTFDDIMSNELKCEAKEKTNDEIILVKCTTTNQDVIDHYDSETIWYGYQETADGYSHYRSINKSKDKVLENMRK